MVAIAIFVPPHCCKAETESLGPTTLTPEAIELHFSPEIGYSFRTVVGGQELSLKVMSNLEGIVLFQTGSSACPSVPSAARCYDPRSSSTAVWCNNNEVCVPGKTDFHCVEVDSPEKIPTSTTTEFRSDGIGHAMESIEGYESIEIRNTALAAPVKFDRVPVKLASKVAKGGTAPWTLNVDGFFGLAGSTISCRRSSNWSEILSKYDGYYVIDLHGTTSAFDMKFAGEHSIG
ncbi:erythrocyte membrane-associated malaria antigen-like protein [Babesia caballi]|uniref:Erythrocyte membrane-associated malaria antigen-like protein n=1 Tax=Babesia caballi TaxID=5871 RepID=A0AAV4LTU7_BABCB|nr:erythrocyte membrane-associated malaria antigen-like protein [Babesia caballi]